MVQAAVFARDIDLLEDVDIAGTWAASQAMARVFAEQNVRPAQEHQARTNSLDDISECAEQAQ